MKPIIIIFFCAKFFSIYSLQIASEEFRSTRLKRWVSFEAPRDWSTRQCKKFAIIENKRRLGKYCMKATCNTYDRSILWQGCGSILCGEFAVAQNTSQPYPDCCPTCSDIKITREIDEESSDEINEETLQRGESSTIREKRAVAVYRPGNWTVQQCHEFAQQENQRYYGRKCVRAECDEYDMSVDFQSCGTVDCGENLRAIQDISKPYPQCCTQCI